MFLFKTFAPRVKGLKLEILFRKNKHKKNFEELLGDRSALGSISNKRSYQQGYRRVKKQEASASL